MAQTKAATPKRKRSWPNVYTRVRGGGQASYVVDIGLINGNRERHWFKTKTEAGTFAELKQTERQNQGTAALAMPQVIKVDAAKASALLIPHNVSLEEAAKYHLKHVIAYRNRPTVSQIVERMIVDVEKNDRRDRTVKDLKSSLGAFAEGFPDRQMSELAVEEIRAWLDENEDWSARTRIHYLTKRSHLFNYALKHNWVDANPVERIDRPSANDCEPESSPSSKPRSC